jgi:hypothetical protein
VLGAATVRCVEPVVDRVASVERVRPEDTDRAREAWAGCELVDALAADTGEPRDVRQRH